MSDDRALSTISHEALERARELNEQGRVVEAWGVLAKEGDKYAERAEEFVGATGIITLFDIFGTRADAQKYQSNYVEDTQKINEEMDILSPRRMIFSNPAVPWMNHFLCHRLLKFFGRDLLPDLHPDRKGRGAS